MLAAATCAGNTQNIITYKVFELANQPSPMDSLDFKSDMWKSAIKVGLYDAFKNGVDKDVVVHKKPSKVVAQKKFQENALRLYPLTTSVGIAIDRNGKPTIPTSAVDLGAVFEHGSNTARAYLKQPSIWPTEKSDGFFAAYWLVNPTADPAEANCRYDNKSIVVTTQMDNDKVHKTTLRMTFIVNNKVIDKGSELKVFKRKRDDEAATQNKKAK